MSENEAPKLPEPIPAKPINNETRAREYDLLLEKLKTQLADEQDPAKQDRLASAIAKIEDVYQVYAGVVKPGTMRPKAQPIRRAAAAFTPIEPSTEAVA